VIWPRTVVLDSSTVPGTHDPRTDAVDDPAVLADPSAIDAAYAALRAGEGLAWHDDPGHWVVARHAEVHAASIDPATFCSGRGILVQEIGTTYDSPPTMMHTDPPAHTRYRNLVSPSFRPSVVRSLESSVRGMAEVLLDALPAGEPVDVVEALAVPFPIRVIAALLGLPPEREHDLWKWSEAAIPGATDWPEDEKLALLGEMATELLALAAERRQEPADDVASLLATTVLATDDGRSDSLDDGELGMFLIQLLVAGNETTRHAVSGGIAALAEHPDQWERLRADRSLVPTAVDEVLRWTTPVISFLRTATVDTVLGGTEVAAGDPLLLLYASADRDEAVFGPDAGSFDVGRSPNPHLAFGFGTHFCLGAALARLELAVVLEGLLDRFDAVAPAGPVERTGSPVIAGLRRVPVTFARR
jgi:cytochrome P450